MLGFSYFRKICMPSIVSEMNELRRTVCFAFGKGVGLLEKSVFSRRVPWTARRSNQSILKKINSEYSLEVLMLKLKLNTLAT